MTASTSLVAVLILLLAGGCRQHDHGTEEDGHGHGHEAPSGASFKPGTGVFLTDETRQSIGLETIEVAERKLPVQIRFNAQVFGENHKATADASEHSECVAKAAGLLAPSQAASLREGQPASLTPKSGPTLGGIVLRVNKALTSGDAEVIVGVTNMGAKVQPGEFLLTSIALPRGESVTVVPKSAVLRAADGTFVYTVNGSAYFRTAVKIGAEAEGFVEITDGLLSGDSVVVRPVEKLWLIELRATKGGGHSH